MWGWILLIVVVVIVLYFVFRPKEKSRRYSGDNKRHKRLGGLMRKIRGCFGCDKTKTGYKI